MQFVQWYPMMQFLQDITHLNIFMYMYIVYTCRMSNILVDVSVSSKQIKVIYELQD